jgi:hypothetical protein
MFILGPTPLILETIAFINGKLALSQGTQDIPIPSPSSSSLLDSFDEFVPELAGENDIEIVEDEQSNKISFIPQ